MVQVLVRLLMAPLVVLVYLVPALFYIFVSLSYFGFRLAVQLTGYPLPTGLLVLLSGLLWSGAALLFLPWLQILLPPGTALLVLAGAGGVWGLCIGGQVAQEWEVMRLRQPNLDPGRQFGLPASLFGRPSHRRRASTLDELLQEGTILGQTEDEP